jgi:hypothetical protein
LRLRLTVAVASIAATLIAAPAAHAGETTITLNWVGDMSFSRAQGLPPNGGKGFFSSVTKLLNHADVSTGNLEGTLGRGGPSKCKGDCFAFQAPPSYASLFRRSGFDVLNLANNHSRDFGTTGLNQTLSALKGAKIAHTGLKGEITVRKVRDVKVAFVGFAPYPWTASVIDIPSAKKLVASAAKRADVVVVFIHAGAEGAGATHTPHGTEHAFGENRGAPRRFSHAVIDSGADAVLGSGPHVLRGIECYRRGIVAYSLGNFAAYRTLSTSGVLGLSGVLEVRITPAGRFDGGQLFPVRLERPGIPRRDPSRASVKLVRGLSKSDFGKSACPISKTGVIKPR